MIEPIIFLAAGHSGCSTGAACTLANGYRIDEGCETLRLRNRIAEILAADESLTVLTDGDREPLGLLVPRINQSLSPHDICIDLHLNASSDPTANGTEVVLCDSPDDFEVLMGVRLLNSAASALNTNVRCVKTESQTPKQRLAMVNLHCHSVILEVCFCTNSHDAELYLANFESLAQALARTIAQLADEHNHQNHY